MLLYDQKHLNIRYVKSKTLLLYFDFASFPLFLLLVHFGFLSPFCGNLRTVVEI